MGFSRNDVLERLKKHIDENYREFHQGLVPGTVHILGVRVPHLRSLAKEVAKSDFRAYLMDVRSITPEIPGTFYEEFMIEGMVIGYGNMSLSESFSFLDFFVPKIRNWAVCDCCCSTYKFMEKYPKESWEYLQKYLKSENEFELRFALVCMLDYYVKEEYLFDIFQYLNSIHHNGYYVKMAIAWLVSVCYVKFPRETEIFLQDNEMDDFTQNKSIQKIRESYRVSSESKERLKKLKRGHV